MLDAILQWDKQALLFLNNDWGPEVDHFFWAVSGKLIWVPLYLFILFYAYRCYGWKTALAAFLFMAAGIGLADMICNAFKEGLEKYRPSHDPEIKHLAHTVGGYLGKAYGTVSAHAATTFSVATFSAYLFRNRWYTLFIYAWAVLICYSRIYLGLHFPMDILLGMALGFGIGYGLFRMFRSGIFSRFYTFKR